MLIHNQILQAAFESLLTIPFYDDCSYFMVIDELIKHCESVLLVFVYAIYYKTLQMIVICLLICFICLIKFDLQKWHYGLSEIECMENISLKTIMPFVQIKLH